MKWNKRVAELVRQYVEPHNLRRVHHTRGQSGLTINLEGSEQISTRNGELPYKCTCCR